MKIAIIGGGGTVGSAAAFCIARRNIADEVVLIDERHNMAKSHAMDMEQAVVEVSKTVIRAGHWNDLDNTAIVIVTAGLPERQVTSRIEFLKGNREIIKIITQQIKTKCPSAIMITASNPVDILNYQMYAAINSDPKKIIGFAENDSTRFRWAIAKERGIDAGLISALAIGEHGDSIFLFDSVRLSGKPLDLTQKERFRIKTMVQSWFAEYQQLNSMRSSGWTSGENIANIAEAIIKKSDQCFVCSAILNGEYGFEDVSIGVPVILGREGIKKIMEVPLNEEERDALETSVKRIQKMI